MFPSLRRVGGGLLAAGVLTVAAACGSTSTSSSGAATSGAPQSAAAQTGTWPRTVKHAKGSTTISAQPTRIVSTSAALTGTLLAVDAPVVGSMATKPNSVGVDKQGFFTQWGEVAQQRGVKPLYEGELDLEAVTAADPDLIVVAATGGDSAIASYEQLSAIAPTVVYNYSDSDWKTTTGEVAEATGHEEKARSVVADYDRTVKDLAGKTKPPATPVHAVVFGGDTDTAFALPSGPHAQVLTALGFKLAPVPTAADAQQDATRKDFAFVAKEASVAALKNPDVFFIGDDADVVGRFKATTGFSTSPAAKSGGHLTPLGASTFKLDPYSAQQLAQAAAAAYPASGS